MYKYLGYSGTAIVMAGGAIAFIGATASGSGQVSPWQLKAIKLGLCIVGFGIIFLLTTFAIRISLPSRSKPQPRPWQFSLRRLLLVMLAICVWFGIGSTWDTQVALVVAYMAILIATFLAVNAGWMRMWAFFIVVPVGGILLMILWPRYDTSIQSQTATLSLRVIDDTNNKPLYCAVVQIFFGKGYYNTAVDRTNEDGIVVLETRFDSQFISAGWNYRKQMITGKNAEFEARAKGYHMQSLTWNDLTRDEWVPANAAQTTPLEIRMQPLPADAEPDAWLGDPTKLLRADDTYWRERAR